MSAFEVLSKPKEPKQARAASIISRRVEALLVSGGRPGGRRLVLMSVFALTFLVDFGDALGRARAPTTLGLRHRNLGLGHRNLDTNRLVDIFFPGGVRDGACDGRLS